ncbi:DUF3037 domain-containing protein [Priestia flexa]|uniref:DUF3037 domain-containing protein n=1 Tax=Priestia flexa TaxID=86664 RepID=A0ABU4JAY0_9BACI|nr:DUF3037 domain-containing protein [Priestia flexa]MDW8518171.1 DUF3037 domain-containing protein [Priestia flexa]
MEKGYFCTIKYLNNPIRDENINIGIIIYSISEHKIHYNINEEEAIRKIKSFYQNADCQYIRTILQDLFEAIDYINTESSIKEKVEELKNIFRNHIRISDEKKFIIDSLDDDLINLYEQQVSFKDEITEKEILIIQSINSIIGDKAFIKNKHKELYNELPSVTSATKQLQAEWENTLKGIVAKSVKESLGKKEHLLENLFLSNSEGHHSKEYLSKINIFDRKAEYYNNLKQKIYTNKSNVNMVYSSAAIIKQSFDDEVNSIEDLAEKTEKLYQPKKEVYV